MQVTERAQSDADAEAVVRELFFTPEHLERVLAASPDVVAAMSANVLSRDSGAPVSGA